MKYTLITKTGKIYTFNIEACAEQFKQAYGGTLFTPQSLAAESIKQKFEQDPDMMAVLIRLSDR